MGADGSMDEGRKKKKRPGAANKKKIRELGKHEEGLLC